eukprot:g23394.t1
MKLPAAAIAAALSADGIGTAGVSDSLMHKLMATKQRLLAGNAEAARAGAARAEPGAWSAANAEKSTRKKGGDGKGKGKVGKGKDGKESRYKQLVPVVREELVALNRQIASHAQAKDLAATRATLETLESKGWTNGHTYAAAVHALSRELLQRMEKEKVLASRPNVRTANTFLRGCLILGSVHDAEALLERMTTVWAAQEEWYKTHGGKPDASTYELVVSLLCQALRYTDARRIALQGIKELGASPGSAAMFASIARAAIICGNEDATALNLKRARKILSEEADFSEAKLSSVAGSGGKRGTQKWNRDEEHDASVADRKAARAKSLEVFQSHRQREILSDLKESDSSASKMCRRLCHKFGLESGSSMAENVLQHFQSVFEPPKKKRKKDHQGKPNNGTQRFDPRRLFSGSRSSGSLHLEICSGSGEWLSSQALRDANTNWMACELRFDRSARCFQRFALRGLAENVGLIVGDAQNALENHLKKGLAFEGADRWGG